MTKLSDTQLVILSAAAQRDDRNVLPLPGFLRGGAAAKVVGALLSCGLIAETVTDSQTSAANSLASARTSNSSLRPKSERSTPSIRIRLGFLPAPVSTETASRSLAAVKLPSE